MIRQFSIAAASLILSAAAPVQITLREQVWTAPGASVAQAHLNRPSECLAVRSPQVEIGRALFRAPVLFGGPAARLGLSCESCHANGRVNAHFFLPELTDRAGAADVTSEWASRTRGDGVFNPVAIPDLVGVSSRATLGQVEDPSLDHFVAGVIEQEFQGEPLPSEAFAALIAYLRALDHGACQTGNQRLTLALAADDVRRALAASGAAADRGTARLLLLAVQDGLGLVAERLPPKHFQPERARLENLAREVGAWRLADDASSTIAAAGPGWFARFDALIADVGARDSETYFDDERLKSALRANSAGR